MTRAILIYGLAAVTSSCLLTTACRADDDQVKQLEQQGFVKLFDGKTLSGWKAIDNPGSWTAQPDGTIRGKGDKSHLFSPKQYTDFEYRAEIKINDGGNSGMYFRTRFEPGFPKGYEAQINSTHRDPKRTGSLYNFVDVKEQLVPPDTWFTQHVVCKGNHIVIKVNGKKVVDFVDDKNTFKKGHFAFQQHDPGSIVFIRHVMVKDLGQKD
jgi:hypothetical protein